MNYGYLSPPSMLMAAAKFQWEDPAAGLLGGGQSKSGRDQADLPGSIYPPVFLSETGQR